MSERAGLGWGWIALVPLACCVGLPVLAGVGVVAYFGIAGAGVAVLAAALVIRALIRRRNAQEARMGHDCCTPTTTTRPAHDHDAGTGARPLVEILYFDGCPNHEGARALVERVSRELDVEPDLRLVNVPDAEAAREMRFLGSPTIRVVGEDVDPEAGARDEYVLSCRVYRTDHGFAGQPDERWVRDALQAAASNGADSASKLQ